MSILNSFPHRCTIKKRTTTKGTLGGTKDSFSSVQTDVVCWEQNATQKEIMDFEKRGMFVSRKIYFLTNPNVIESNVILITERSGVTVTNPITLEVRTEATPDASAGLGILYKLFCSEKTGEDD